MDQPVAGSRDMKILMIAPEPFFQPRGTPFSEYYRIKALSELGYHIDLATYPFGEDREIPNLRIFRSFRPPGIKGVKIGPSWAKLPLNFFLFFKSLFLLCRNHYDFIHTHEEAGIMGVIFSRIFRIPNLYDMHSDLAQQMVNFNFTRSRRIIRLVSLMERSIVKGSNMIIGICPYLEDVVKKIDPHKQIYIIENPPLKFDEHEGDEAQLRRLRESLKLQDKRVILYTGTFEPYQGLELLLQAIPSVVDSSDDVHFLIVGGEEEQIASLKALTRQLKIEGHVSFTGQRPYHEMPLYLQLADILVSPRIKGDNVPLKIYLYLTTGKPIVATNISAHTQVLNPEVAVLTEPEPQSFALGIDLLLKDYNLCQRLTKSARKLVETKYSYPEYLKKVKLCYQHLSQIKTKRRGNPSARKGELSKKHYSYRVYASQEVAAKFDEDRFGGPIGQLIQQKQEATLLSILGDFRGKTILDIGAGTGRTAIPLAHCGARVTALDASAEMLTIARQKAEECGADISFQQGDAHQLPYPDSSFDMVVCFRLLIHAVDWKKVIGEFCRVARGTVVFDFSPWGSFALLHPPYLHLKKFLDKKTQTYRVLRMAAIKRELRRHGFQMVSSHREFVLPLAVHRKLNSVRFTTATESLFGRLKINSFFGGPLTIKANRKVG
ncbi:hypothetical protein CEE39_07415 [bacterium (candidate division B38) B3_B38]|nr:MAG: hypothetical protein CEE39_07415 [bacterium (candidate division B38) B3_B38]